MRLSEAGLRLIQTFEGLRLDAYPDPGTGGEPWTIGFGTTRYPGGRRVEKGDRITEAQAREYLANDVARFEDAVTGMVTAPISQSQFDALVSLAYNIGTDALRRSTLIRELNAGNAAAAADQFMRWVYAGGAPMEGLRRRRRAEQALFLASQPVTVGIRPEPVSAPTAQPVSTPMSPFVIPALDALARLVPTIADLFKGEAPSKVAERNVEAVKTIADKVIPIVVAATGAPNVQAAVEAAEADPGVARQIDDAARREYYELQRVSIREAREFAVEYAQVKDVRTVVGRLTFLELLTLVILTVSATLTGWLIHKGLLVGELLGAVVTMVVVAGFVDVRKFWMGLPASEPPKDR